MKDKNNNLEETKIFKSIDEDSDDFVELNDIEDTLDIPFSKKEDTSLRDTINLSKEEIIDEGLSNIRAAEDEINKVLEVQNGGNGDDNMAKKNKKRKLSGLGKFNLFLLTMVTFMIIGFIGAGMFWISLSVGTPDLDIAVLANETSSVLLDKDGEQFFDLGMYAGDGATYQDIEYQDMSQNVIDAFVSIEDSRFFKHKGFDVPRFTKAIVENLTAGSFAQGGSTITMQLIKTSHLTAAKNITRKAQEINLALDVENKIGKDKIFEYYVNKINYGAGNSRGLESAAQYYFDKPASNLTISESALLAGVVNRPNSFSPINNLDRAYKRRNKVLDLMEYHGYIDEDEMNLAKSVKIENQLTDVSSDGLKTDDNPYIDYVNAVIDEVSDRLGIDIVATPLTIHTHMDPRIQEDVAAIQNSEGYQYPDDYMQSAVAIGDNETGALMALGAGRDSQVVKGRNRATRMFQQPGSVTKPLLSYALAFEKLGWATSHVVEDRPTNYAGTDKYLTNYSGNYLGEITIKDALTNSINTAAYATLLEVEQEIGRDAVADYLHDSLGFTKVSREKYDTQYAIGGSTFQISPAELFGAQAVMMNGGFYTKPHTVDYVETSSNEIIKDEFDYPKTRVISEETAYLVSVLEEYNVSSGVINRMEILGGRPYKVYAKTGTTDYGNSAVHLGVPENAGKDQWMMASSKAYTSVVWMGWDKPEAGKTTWWTDYKYSANPLGFMNQRILNTLHQGQENPGNVERPAGVSDITHVISTFPYANPIDGMDSQYITTGEIATKDKNLVDLNKANVSLESVGNFSANITANKKSKTVSLSWSKYPSDGAIKDKYYDMSLDNIKATGTRLFHPSWIFGPVQYKARIYVDGERFENIAVNQNNYSNDFNIPNGKDVRICGYYGNNQQDGNEKCVNVNNPDIKKNILIPNFKSLDEIKDFLEQFKIPSDFWNRGSSIPTDNEDNDQTLAGVTHNGTDIRNSSLDLETLKKMRVTMTFYEYDQSNIDNESDNDNNNNDDEDDEDDDDPNNNNNDNNNEDEEIPPEDGNEE